MLYKHWSSDFHLKIASLTTLSTPHSGSSFADYALENLPGLVGFLNTLGLDVSAFPDLTVKSTTSWANMPEVVDFETNVLPQYVQIRTYAGQCSFLATLAVLKLSHAYISKKEGENDGLVSIESAKWQPRYFQGVIPNCDHLNEVCHWHLDHVLSTEKRQPFLDRMYNFYLQLVEDMPIRDDFHENMEESN
ncbi:hypothetical protein RCL1_007799 [Eukaryota sp. TZLM3-RCL]